MKEQGRKLIDALSFVARTAYQPQHRRAGRQVAVHQARGLRRRPEAFTPVGEALIWTLEQALADEFTPDTKSHGCTSPLL